jgi:threonine dehydrogenase-like Zn-dependent dehydrogenase
LRAVICQNTELTVGEQPEPIPARGQARIEVLRCGICGSDLHAVHGFDELAEVAGKSGYDGFGRVSQPIVLGHEFCGTVAEYGPKSKKTVREGTAIVALPLLRGPDGKVAMTGLSLDAPGAYADQLLVEEHLMFAVPNGLAPHIATLTEPMAVALHAVNRSEIGKRDTAVVIGCGPVGLGVILMLKARGVKNVVASDFSPRRRELAARCGADVVVDPASDSPYAARAKGQLPSTAAALELAVSSIETMGRLPIGWWHLWRLGDKLGATAPKRPVIFECVGLPGMIEDVIEGAPMFSRVVVVGVCIGSDAFTPAMALNKELDLRFVFGYMPLEFRDALHLLADGTVDPSPLVTGTVGLGGVEGAFADLGSPEHHAKILINPAL